MNGKELTLHVLECAKMNIGENAGKLNYSLEALDRLSNAVSDVEEMYGLLECAVTEIEKVHGKETELTRKVRELIEGVS